MNFEDTILSAGRLKQAFLLPDWPCVFVESYSDSEIARLVQPGCPLILIGEGDGPIPDVFDLRVPDRARARRLFDRISSRPNTARVIVNLLRMLPRLTLTDGLQAESLAYGVLQGSAEYTDWLGAKTPSEEPVAEGRIEADRRDDVLKVEMHRPWADNAIDRPMRDGLALMFQIAVADPSIRKIVLTGAGRSFSLGADLDEFGTTRDPAQAHAIRQLTLPANWAAHCGERFEARIQGACVGAGLELAAFAGRIVASPKAWFQLPELNMGLLPGAGGCVSLTRRIGRHRTGELILSGQRLSARKALDWGLVDEIASDEGSGDEA